MAGVERREFEFTEENFRRLFQERYRYLEIVETSRTNSKMRRKKVWTINFNTFWRNLKKYSDYDIFRYDVSRRKITLVLTDKDNVVSISLSKL